MRNKEAILILLLFLGPIASAQNNFIVDWNVEGEKFEEFVSRSESIFPVRFFYNELWTRDIRLGDYGKGKQLTEILDTLFKGSDIFYYVDESSNIVLTKYFEIKRPDDRKSENKSYIPGLDYEESSDVKTTTGNIVVDIGFPADRNKPGNATLSGYVLNQDTREAVAGVTIHIPSLSVGTISNMYGFYNLTVPRGSYSVKYSFIGMKERVIDMNLYGDGELNVDMRSTLVPLKEAIITADKNITLQRFEVGVEKINITSFRLIKSILLIPGVQSVGEGSAGFNVRGGSVDQNLILLYGAPIYNSSHFFGFFSAVNSDIIKDVTLYKGGIPGRYGGRISSVLDITPREGNRKEFAGNAGISPVTTHFFIEGPVKKDTCYYLLSGRTTYSNWILGLLENSALKNSRASFYDLNARVAYDLNRNNKIDFSAYYSNDSFRFNSDTTYSYANNIFAIRWRHFFNSRFFSALSVNNSNYRYNISSVTIPAESFSLFHSINSTGLKYDFNLFPGRHELNFGADLTRYDVLPGKFFPAHDSSLVIPNSIQRQRGLESALYIEDSYVLTEYLSVNAGLRFSSFFAMGPQTVFKYNEAYPRTVSSITDTLHFGMGKSYKTYLSPELRLSVNLRISNTSSVKVNYNHTKQYLHLLSNTTSISPTDTWKLSDYFLKPQVGDQVAAGYYRMIYRNKIEASGEVYYKKIQDMVDFKGGTNLIMNEYIERDLINVDGRAYGMEFLVKKPDGRLRWSIAYTYSRVLSKSSGIFDEEKINGGNWFPANYDKPHDLIMTFNYLYSRRMSFSASYNYSSGRPVTYPVSLYKIEDIVLVEYSDRNKYRIPYYSRLDLSLKISGNLKSKKIAHPNWIFSIYNVTGRQNVYSVFFRKERNTLYGYMLSVFGRPIPSVTFNFDF
jgi:hypothetical protein